MSKLEQEFLQNLSDLNNANSKVRRKAAKRLGEIGKIEAVGSLLTNLSHEDEIFRKAIVRTLKQLGDTQAIDPLIQQFNKDTSVKVKALIAWTLGHFNYYDFDMECLISALDEENLNLKRKIIFALGNKRYKKAVPKLIELLNSNEKHEVRILAIWALGQIQDRGALEPLIELLNDSSEKIRKRAASTLVYYPYTLLKMDKMLKILSDCKHNGRLNAVYILGKLLYNKSVPDLIKIIENQWQHFIIRKKAIEALGRMTDSRAYKTLAKAINDPSQSIRITAIKSLSNDYNIDDETLLTIIDKLNDDYSQVRLAALRFLCAIIGSTYLPIEIFNAIPKLKELLLSDPNKEIRVQVIQLFMWMREKNTYVYLHKALEDSDEEVRKNAASALNYLREKFNLEPFFNDLNHPLKKVRSGSSYILRQSQELVSFKDKLIDVLDDKEHLGREHVINLLAKIRPKGIEKRLINILKQDKDLETRKAAMWALEKYDTPEIELFLIEQIEDPDKEISKIAIYILKNNYPSVNLEHLDLPDKIWKIFYDKKKKKIIDVSKEDKTNANKLLEILKSNKNNILRWKATVALAKHFENNIVIEPLIEALSDTFKGVRVAAAYALGKIKNKKIIKPLLLALNDPFKKVRLIATRSLKKIVNKDNFEDIMEEIRKPEHLGKDYLITLLGELKSEKSISLLVDLIENDDNYKVKHAAIYAVYHWIDERILDALMKAINDPDRKVRSSALSILLYGPHEIKTKKEYLINKFKDKTSYGRYEIFYLIGGERIEKSLCTPDFIINALNDNHFYIKMSALVKFRFFAQTHHIPTDYKKIRRIVW